MSKVVDNIKQELLKRCKQYEEKYGYDFWNDHIKYVVKNAVELGALLHDIAMPSEIGPREEHNVYGAKIADELLSKLNYPEERKERVKECVLRHRGSKDLPRNTIEEQCVADADVIAHFDCIPSVFRLAFCKDGMDMSVADGTKFVKKKLERDFYKLSKRTKEELKERYENIMQVLFVDKT